MKKLFFYDRSKHIYVKLHFIRDIIVKGDFIIENIVTNLNPLATLTKSLNFLENNILF